MESTSVTLLKRLRQSDNQEAWERFVQIYTPLLYHWVRRFGVTATEASDLLQEVFTHLVQQLPKFEYDPSRSFRSWLCTVTRNRCLEILRQKTIPVQTTGESGLQQLAESGGDLNLEEREYRQFIIHRAIQVMQSDFQPTTWKSFFQHVVQGLSVAEVAADLGIPEKRVYRNKARVLQRLRQELEGMLD